MSNYTQSQDGSKIYYEVAGQGKTALLFVHGWMGNSSWWNHQRDYFSKKYLIVQMDLAGHGKSDKSRTDWSVQNYAYDIEAVANKLAVEKIILVGHSMSGSNITLAYPLIKKTVALILVDTLKNLDQQLMPQDQFDQFFGMYRKEFKRTIKKITPQYLFVKTSPKEVVERLINEFLEHSPELSVATLQPFYKTDIRDTAKKIGIPVRAINAELPPTETEITKKYFKDFSFKTISGVGHYPMLENPNEFNHQLETILNELNF